MAAKVDVNENRHPLYRKLIAAVPKAVAPKVAVFTSVWPVKGAPLYPDDILWNFEKFLIGRDGRGSTLLAGYDARRSYPDGSD